MAASNGLFIETVHLFAARPHFQPPPREQQEEEQQQEEEEEEEEEDYCSSAHVDVSVTEAFSSCRFDGSKPSVGHFRSSSSSARPILMFVCFAFRFYVGLGAVSAIFFFLFIVLSEVASSFKGIWLGSFGMRILRRILWRDPWSRCQVLKGSLRIAGHPLPF